MDHVRTDTVRFIYVALVAILCTTLFAFVFCIIVVISFIVILQVRIQFKVAVLTYKVLHGCAPSYLGPFVRVSDLPSRRALRFANTSRLIQPHSNRSSVGDRAFPVAGPQVWNSLPPEVTSAPSLDTFRRRLKTHLFTVSYSNIQLS